MFSLLRLYYYYFMLINNLLFFAISVHKINILKWLCVLCCYFRRESDDCSLPNAALYVRKMNRHQVLTGAANSGDRCFAVGNINGIHFTVRII